MASKKDRKRSEQRYKLLEQIISVDEENRKLVKYRYKVLGSMISRMYPQLREMPSETLWEAVRDIVLADRQLRDITSDVQQEEKEILSQEWQLNNGYEPGFNRKLNV